MYDDLIKDICHVADVLLLRACHLLCQHQQLGNWHKQPDRSVWTVSEALFAIVLRQLVSSGDACDPARAQEVHTSCSPAPSHPGMPEYAAGLLPRTPTELGSEVIKYLCVSLAIAMSRERI